MGCYTNESLVELLQCPRDTIRKLMEAEVVANSLSHGDAHQPLELHNGMVEEILRPERASMNLLVQTDTTNMGRVRTYSTCNMDEMLELDVEGSTLNSMMLNEEVMEQTGEAWTSGDLGAMHIKDEAHIDILPCYTKQKQQPTLLNLSSVDMGDSKPCSPSLNMLNANIVHTATIKQTGKMKLMEEPDFNVLHLDDHSITDLESFPLFSMEDDVGSLLEQFEEVSQSGSIDAEDLMANRKEIYDLSIELAPLPVYRVSSDSSLPSLMSSTEQAHLKDIKEESPEVVKLLKLKPALSKLSKPTPQHTGNPSNVGDAKNKKMPNPEVLRKIRNNNKRKSAILLSDALPNRTEKSYNGNKLQPLPVYASKKLRKLLGHTAEDSNTDQSEREEAKKSAQTIKRANEKVVVSSLEDVTNMTVGIDTEVFPATPETITAPSTPANPSGGNSGCSTPDIPKKKISLSAYKSRLASMQKGSSSGSATPVNSGRSTPVKEFEDNTQIIINTVKAKLTAQLDNSSKLPSDKNSNSYISNNYSITMDHDYCQASTNKVYKKDTRTNAKVADTWGVNPHAIQKPKAKKVMNRCLSLPAISVQNCEQSIENSHRTSSKRLPSPKMKLPDLLAHPPLHPIKSSKPKEKVVSSPVKQTAPVEVLPSDICTSAVPAEQPVSSNEPEAENKQQISMLKDLLLSSELQKEMQEQAKVDREQCMRRMSSKSSLSPDIADHVEFDDQFQEVTEAMDAQSAEPLQYTEGERAGNTERLDDLSPGHSGTAENIGRLEDLPANLSKMTENTARMEDKDSSRFSKFESEKENTLVCDTKAQVTEVKKQNSKHQRRRYRNKNRSQSPENLKEPYFDKLPNYCTALAHRNEIETHKNFTDIQRLADSGLPTRDRDPSPERDAAMFNKVPAYFQCFTNSTRYDNAPERESPVVVEDSYHWTDKVSCEQQSTNSSRATSPGLVINTRPTSRANSRSRPSSRISSQSPTTLKPSYSVCGSNMKRTGRQKQNRKRSYSCSSSSRSPSCSRSRSRSVSRSCSRSRSRSQGRSRRCRSPGYRRHTKRRKCSRSRSRSTSWDRWKVEQRKRREEEKRSKMKQRKIVYVGGIPDDYSKKDMRKSFDKFGRIEDVSLHFREHGDNYGFVTFMYRCDAFAAIEMGKSVPGCAEFDLCFGGRRLFCKTRYEDLDGNMEDEEEMAPVLSQPAETLDFDKLLRQALKKKT